MNGRDENGQFAKGNKASVGNHGGGRKRREEEDAIKAALDAALPTADVVKKLASAVKRGQAWAIQLWLAYRWGKPLERVEATGDDGGPIRIIYDG